MSDIGEQRPAAALGQRIERLRPARDEMLFDGDIAGIFELAQMNTGIAVGRLGRVAHCGKIG